MSCLPEKKSQRTSICVHTDVIPCGQASSPELLNGFTGDCARNILGHASGQSFGADTFEILSRGTQHFTPLPTHDDERNLAKRLEVCVAKHRRPVVAIANYLNPDQGWILVTRASSSYAKSIGGLSRFYSGPRAAGLSHFSAESCHDTS